VIYNRKKEVSFITTKKEGYLVDGKPNDLRDIGANILTRGLLPTEGEVTYHFDPTTGTISVECSSERDKVVLEEWLRNQE
jgi:hypothetical protein